MEKIENLKLLTKEEIEELDFFEAAYYIQTLNQIEKANSEQITENENE